MFHTHAQTRELKQQPQCDSTRAVLLRSRDTKSPFGNFIRRHLFIPQGMDMNWLFALPPERHEESERAGSTPPLRTSDHRDRQLREESGSTSPPHSPLVVVSRDTRRQATQRAHPVSCARRTGHVTRRAVTSRSEASARRVGLDPEPPWPGTPACCERPSPGPRGAGRWASGRGQRAGGTSPGRGAARLRSGAETGRPAGPRPRRPRRAREPAPAESVQRAKQSGWGQGCWQGMQRTELKEMASQRGSNQQGVELQ
jgi:hypothetical protein